MMTTNFNEISIRTKLLMGDLGYIAYMHGRIYHKECEYGFVFEKYVLQGLADLASQYDSNKDCVWICEHEGHIIGSIVGLFRDDNFQLRFFILLPEYRNMGLGKKLMQLFIDFMIQKGYKKAFLWTTNEQLGACSLYEKFGFRLTQELPSEAFGKQLVERRYDLLLI